MGVSYDRIHINFWKEESMQLLQPLELLLTVK